MGRVPRSQEAETALGLHHPPSSHLQRSAFSSHDFLPYNDRDKKGPKRLCHEFFAMAFAISTHEYPPPAQVLGTSTSTLFAVDTGAAPLMSIKRAPQGLLAPLPHVPGLSP